MTGANRWCKQGNSLEACTCSFSVCHTLPVLDPNLWPCCDYLSSYPWAFLQVLVQIMHNTSLRQELFAAIADIKLIRAETVFSFLSLLPLYQHSLQRMKDVFSFRIWTCYNGVPNSKHLHIILVLEVTMTCSFAFSVWLVLCEVLDLMLIFDVCAKNTFFLFVHAFFSPFWKWQWFIVIPRSLFRKTFHLNEQFAVDYSSGKF